MSTRIHYIVARSRNGWSVNVDADLLSEHEDVRDAREEAAMLAGKAREAGCEASLVDLSEEPGPGETS
jgi:hypothetical protein